MGEQEQGKEARAQAGGSETPRTAAAEPAQDVSGRREMPQAESDMSAEAVSAARSGMGGIRKGLRSADEMGGEIVTVVRDTVSTTIKSVGVIGDDAIVVTRDVVKEAISATEEVGSDLVTGVTHVAKDIVHGVRDVGTDAGLVLRDGANGTVAVVADVGESAVNALTRMLVGLVGGVRQAAGTAMRGPATGVVGAPEPGHPMAAGERPRTETTAQPQPQPQPQQETAAHA